LFILGSGILFGFGLNLVRPLAGAGLAFVGVMAVIAVALWLFWHWNLWFDWVLIAGFQIPGAWTCSVVSHTLRIDREKEILEERLSTRQATPQIPEIVFPEVQVPEVRKDVVVPDHELVRCIGKGAYGEVWLARNAIGTYHAAKIVYRGDFSSHNSYAREFKGIQKYMPISRSHPGLVQILHTGRNDAAGYYYCIMECGDDEKDGPIIHPESYSPRNLSKDLRRHGRMLVPECIGLAIALADALDFLHQHDLIHRDVKPSNIIFVNGAPKLADIGLVTDIVKPGDAMTGVGTFYYIAPEGPGRPTADIYALGKVIYVAATGRDVGDYPELPTFGNDISAAGPLLRLNTIILKACADLDQRYQRVSDLRTDLLRVHDELRQPREG